MSTQSQRIGDRFVIDDPDRDQLGRGGMGDVYRGMDLKTGEPVAIKVLRPAAVVGDPDVVARFLREGKALRQLNHPNIVQIVAAVEDAGQHFIVMEYVPGGSLRDLLKQEGRLSVERTVAIALEVADALTRVHHLGIIHRDLKPSNVLLAEDGMPRLTDFGHARLATSPRLTETGAVVGTVFYLSPEACRGETLDVRADIWAFGVMLYEMLVGEPPFAGQTLPAVFMAILSQPVPDLAQGCPNVPDALADLVYRMLEKDRGQRIPSVRLVGAELEAVSEGSRAQVKGWQVERPRQPPIAGRFDMPTPLTEIPKHNLPVQPTPFVGRKAELVELDRLLSDPDVRLVTILGVGGMGKTRLALQATEAQLDRFADGVYFVPLAPLQSTEAIVPAIAEALGFSFYQGVPPRQQLLDYLRQKQMLLLLDNFEHLLACPEPGRGDGAGIAADILKTAGGIKILATSRVRLNVLGEHRFHIAGMDFPGWETLEDALGYSAVKLFMQAAKRAQPGFELADGDLEHVARVCRLVGGMPLGILLAAAWVEMLTPKEIAVELAPETAQSLDVLETDLHDVPERQRNVRTVFDHSWSLLTEEEQVAMQALSVFRGGFTREAGQRVTGASLRALMALVNKSLLHRSPTGRYEIHELLRQFAAEKLAQSPNARKAVLDKHCAYYANALQQWEESLTGSQRQAALAAMDIEIENARSAWDWAVSQVGASQDPVPYIVILGQCTQGLVQFCTQAGLFREGEQAFRTAADRAQTVAQGGQTLSPERLAAVLQTLSRLRAAQGHLLACLGDHSTALAVFQEADAAFGKAAAIFPDTDLAERAMLLSDLGAEYNRTGDYALAVQHLEAGLTLARQVNDTRAEIIVLSNLAQATSEQGAYDTAKQHLDEMLSLARACDDRAHVAFALSTLGTIAWRWGDIEQADRCNRESLAIYRELGDRHRISRILNSLGIMAILRELYDQAEGYWEEGLAMIQEMGDRQAMADTLNNLGYINHHHLGNLEKAKQYYQESLSIGQEIGHRHGATSTLSNLGHLYVLMGEHAPAWDHLRQALSESTAIGVAPLTLDALVGVARLRAETGQGDSAAELLGVVLNHPAVEVDSAQVANTVLAGLRDVLPAEQLEAAMERGKMLELDAVVAELLAEDR